MGLSGRAAQAADQLTPPGRRRVALDAGQVIRCDGGVHVPQFQRDGSVQELLAGRGRHLIAAAQHHHPEVGLVAQRPQRGRPELRRDLIEPVQDHRDLGGPHQLSGIFQAPLCPRTSDTSAAAAPRATARCARAPGSHPCAVTNIGTGTSCRSGSGICARYFSASRMSSTAGAALARSGATDDHHPAGSQAPVDSMQFLQPSSPELPQHRSAPAPAAAGTAATPARPTLARRAAWTSFPTAPGSVPAGSAAVPAPPGSTAPRPLRPGSQRVHRAAAPGPYRPGAGSSSDRRPGSPPAR